MSNILDGTPVIGSQVLTIPTTSGATYIGEDITLDSDSKLLQTMDATVAVNMQALIPQPFTGTATLQLSAGTILPPAIGAPFTIVPYSGGTALACWVKKVGTAFKQGEVTKYNISFGQKIN